MSGATSSPKPMPVPDAQSQEFFDAAARGVLLLRRCADCQAWLLPDARLCCECLSETLAWAESSGRGEIFTFGIVHQQVPGWEADTPFNVTVVQLEEGVRLTTNVTGCENADLRVGLPVSVTFVDAGNGTMIPKFQPR